MKTYERGRGRRGRNNSSKGGYNSSKEQSLRPRGILRSVKTELGSILDTLIELLPRQNPNYIQEYALLMTRVRELIKDIEKYV